MRCRLRSTAFVIGSLLIVAGCSGDYRVAVAGGTVTVDRALWKPLANPDGFADNFEARERRLGEEYSQVLTVFKAAMRNDQKAGIEVSPGTWVEFMFIYPPAVTFQVRVSHGGHWVMSRQTMSRRSATNAVPPSYIPFLPPDHPRALLGEYSAEIARTRSILDALVAR
jgi:hypothetical protein